MADQNTQFYAILTNVGAAKQANADALGIPWRITQLGIGDANGTEPTPNATQTRLINEWRRAPLNQLKVDDKNNAIIVAEQIIPAEVGGKWIREVALYDDAGDMVAVANCPPTYKPLLSQGSGRTQVVRMNLLVSVSSNVELKIDPAVVLATRDYVDNRITEEISKLDNKQSVRAATTGNIALAGLQTIDGVQLVSGDRVLVKNQTAAKDNGLYVAAVGAWSRSSDADASAEVTSGVIVAVEQGTTFADTIWQLITDGPIVLGTTSLVFRDITDGFARLLSPAFVGTPTSTLPDQFDSSKRLATTEFVKRAGLEFSSFGSVAVSTAMTAANIGGLLSASNATPITITLPSTVGAAQGATVAIVSAGTGAVTVSAANGDLVSTSTGAVGPITLGLGDSAEFIKLAGQWLLTGGSILLRYSQVLSDNGFVTQAQFNSAQRLATTEFVQRALGSFSGAVSYGANVTLTKAEVGKVIRLGGTGYTLTLPLISSVVEGATFAIQHSGTSGTQTVVVQGGDVIDPGLTLITSLTLNMGDTAILTRASGVWALIAGSAALSYVDRPTLPQFDNSRQLATTEFVQRALGSYADLVSYPDNVALTAADVGKLVSLSGTAPTVTLPDASLVAQGAVVTILAAGGGAKLQAKAGQTLRAQNGVTGLFDIPATALVVCRRLAGGIGWALEGGDAALKFSALFASVLGPGNAAQTLPGLSIKAGNISNASSAASIPLTFPVSFPTACVALLLSGWYGVPEPYVHQGRDRSGAAIFRGTNTSYQLDYIALGY